VGWDLNPKFFKYKVGLLTTTLQHFVKCKLTYHEVQYKL
jgi:hypothetical protein